jgi:predicted transcriptional regulator
MEKTPNLGLFCMNVSHKEPKDVKIFNEEEKAKGQRQTAGKIKRGFEQPRSSRSDNQDSERNSQECAGTVELTEFETEIIDRLAESLQVLGNSARLKILLFCREERSFSEIMRAFSLNPASIKHHQESLQEKGLLVKNHEGRATRYKITPLGNTLISFACTLISAIRKT